MNRRYVVVGGYLFSARDGQVHYVSPSRLCELYGVNPADCHLFRETAEYLAWARRTVHETMPILRPRADGDYADHMWVLEIQAEVRRFAAGLARYLSLIPSRIAPHHEHNTATSLTYTDASGRRRTCR